MTPQEYMRRAIELAKEAAAAGEVPVGAVVVYEDRIIGEGRNRREERQSALCHAEIEAIEAACREVGSWRLNDCELYVTLEPCPMCTGAAINARLRKVYYGAADPHGGAAGSLTNLFELPYSFKVEREGGILAEECAALLSDFFEKLRKKKAEEK